MNKKPIPRKKSKTQTSTKLLAKDIRRIRRQVKQLEEQVYYVVYERPFRGVETRFYLDVSESAFHPSLWPCATLFKEERLARFVAREYSVQQEHKRKLYVAPVTIQVSGKRGGGHK